MYKVQVFHHSDIETVSKGDYAIDAENVNTRGLHMILDHIFGMGQAQRDEVIKFLDDLGGFDWISDIPDRPYMIFVRKHK